MVNALEQVPSSLLINSIAATITLWLVFHPSFVVKLPGSDQGWPGCSARFRSSSRWFAKFSGVGDGFQELVMVFRRGVQVARNQ